MIGTTMIKVGALAMAVVTFAISIKIIEDIKSDSRGHAARITGTILQISLILIAIGICIATHEHEI